MYTIRKYSLLLALLPALMALGACKSKQKATAKAPEQVAGRQMPPELAAKYKEDAARLTLREVLSSTGSDANLEANLPKERVEYYYSLLEKCYWMMQDSANIPHIEYIHTFKNPDLNRVSIVLEKNSPLKDSWSQGRTLSTNLYLNQVTSRYRLKIKNYRETDYGPTLILESPNYINTEELAHMLSNVEGIKMANPDSFAGDGNDISYGSGGGKNHSVLRYSVGAGDCPSGCIYRKYWTFYVNHDGSIQYMGERGIIPPELEKEIKTEGE